MTTVTEVREETGIELLDTDVELSDDAKGEVFRIEDDITIEVGETAGHDVTVDAKHFVAASVDAELDESTAAMTGEEEIHESSVFISNEDGDVGAGLFTVDGGDIDDAIERFEDEYL